MSLQGTYHSRMMKAESRVRELESELTRLRAIIANGKKEPYLAEEVRRVLNGEESE